MTPELTRSIDDRFAKLTADVADVRSDVADVRSDVKVHAVEIATATDIGKEVKAKLDHFLWWLIGIQSTAVITLIGAIFTLLKAFGKL